MKHLISGLGKAASRVLKPECNLRAVRTALFGAALMAAGLGHAQGIAGSKHDLSTNYDPISNQVCMYCHTPHHANSSLSDINAPLWNRAIDRTKVHVLNFNHLYEQIKNSQKVQEIYLGTG